MNNLSKMQVWSLGKNLPMASHCLLDQVQIIHSGLHRLSWSDSHLSHWLCLLVPLFLTLSIPALLNFFSIPESISISLASVSSHKPFFLSVPSPPTFLSAPSPIPFQSKTSTSLPPGKIPCSSFPQANSDPAQNKYGLKASSPMHSSGALYFPIKAHNALHGSYLSFSPPCPSDHNLHVNKNLLHSLNHSNSMTLKQCLTKQ